MKIKSLEHVDFKVVMDCFLKAFKNYFVDMPTDHSYYKERWRMANVNYSLSYGMFDKEELVGFIINAIDYRNNRLIAYNTGTGVLPAYRGKGIVRSIYEFAIPKLKEKEVEECTLEVIKKNIPAIKAYEKIGFKIIKTYKCYSGELNVENIFADFESKQVDLTFFDWSVMQQHLYSWDNQIETLKRGKYDFYVVNYHKEAESYFVINPANGYLAQFNVFNDAQQCWARLFLAIQGVSNTVKVNNVDKTLVSKIYYMEHFGLRNTVDQYEMSLEIS